MGGRGEGAPRRKWATRSRRRRRASPRPKLGPSRSPFAGGPPALGGGGLREPFAPPPPSSSPVRAPTEPGEGGRPAVPAAEPGGAEVPSVAAWSPPAPAEPGLRRWKKALPRGRSRGQAAGTAKATGRADPGPAVPAGEEAGAAGSRAAPGWSWDGLAEAVPAPAPAEEATSILYQVTIEACEGQPVVTAARQRAEPLAAARLCPPWLEAGALAGATAGGGGPEEKLGCLGQAVLEQFQKFNAPAQRPAAPAPAEVARVLDSLGSISIQPPPPPPRAPTPYPPHRHPAARPGPEPASPSAPGSPRAEGAEPEANPSGERGTPPPPPPPPPRPPAPFHFEAETAACPAPPHGDGDKAGESPAAFRRLPEAPRPAAPRPRVPLVPCRALARAKAKRAGAKAKALPWQSKAVPSAAPKPPEKPKAPAAKPKGQKCKSPRWGKEAPAAERKPPEQEAAGASEPPAPASRWPPFQVGDSCPRRCHCKHQDPRRLPRNVSAWLAPSANHLAEPPWVSTAILASSLVAGTEFLLDAYEEQGAEED
ncbi:gametogenetin [Rhea pennata]|uniref:gametogenetin n=1 Tax=Rhea pennata TaxID=8795 RepID=UPI002E256A01